MVVVKVVEGADARAAGAGAVCTREPDAWALALGLRPRLVLVFLLRPSVPKIGLLMAVVFWGGAVMRGVVLLFVRMNLCWFWSGWNGEI